MWGSSGPLHLSTAEMSVPWTEEVTGDRYVDRLESGNINKVR